MIYKIKTLLDNIKFAYQRVVRGYDDRAYWSLNDYVSEIVIPVLHHLSKNIHSGPDELFEKDDENPTWRWQNILSDMAKGFEAHQKLHYGKYKKDEINKLLKDQKRGLYLFVRWFDDLWD